MRSSAHDPRLPGAADIEQRMSVPNAVMPASAGPRYRQPTRRGAEAGLFVLAFVVGAAAYIQVDLAILGKLASDTVPVLSSR